MPKPPSAGSPEFHSMGGSEALGLLNTKDSGLSPEEASTRLERSGPNELVKGRGVSMLGLFLGQFKSFLIIVLIAATLVSFAMGEVTDAAVIAVIVALNAAMGFTQEYRAEKSLEALKRMVSATARVVRGGKEAKISSLEIVPGDILLLEAGDKVPADARLLESLEIRVDEAALTGESLPVEKTVDILKPGTALADRANMAYSGTVIVYGKGRAVVTSTGMGTELGKIAALVQETEKEETPLQKKLETVGKQLGMLILVICAVVFAVGMLRVGWEPEHATFMFLAAVSLAVAAIPEGLPAVVTMALALGTQRMAKKNAIVRRLPAVETLGSCDVICSDKTGTFTRNEMTVKGIYFDGRDFGVEGSGYSPVGGITEGGKAVKLQAVPGLDRLVNAGVLCNNAALAGGGMGDPTEIALLVLGAKAGLEKDKLDRANGRIREVLFDSNRKRMSTVHETGEGRIVYAKGAVESVLGLCDRVWADGKGIKLDGAGRKRILEKNDEMAQRALRVLGIAYKSEEAVGEGDDEIESRLVFLGMVGMIDPPREEVKESIALCRTAGIAVKMITGDHAVTARAIAKDIGLPEGDAVTGEELDRMSDAELRKRVDGITVFARVNPEHKLRIVEALKAKGHIVAMTGDGVNDAPALKRADIGVAMGITGTEVTKEAGSMVLTDDNFATIVAAIEEGRGIYNNIKKFIRFLLSSNFGEVLALFLGILLFPIKSTVLMPVQILWVNLVTDGAPALALGVERKANDIMGRPPRPSDDQIFSGMMLKTIVLVGLVMAAGTLGVYYAYNPAFEDGTATAAKAGTMAFTTLMFFQIVNAFNCRSEDKSAFNVGRKRNNWLILAVIGSVLLQCAVIYVPFLSNAFGTVPLGLLDWAAVVAVSLSVLVAVEAYKAFERRCTRRAK